MYTCIQMYTDWDLKYSTPIISPVNAGGEEKLDKKGSLEVQKTVCSGAVSAIHQTCALCSSCQDLVLFRS